MGCDCALGSEYNYIMAALKITSIGGVAGIVLPEEVLHRLGVAPGDTLYLTETPRGIELTPLDPKVAQQLAVAEGVMPDNREVLKRLAE